MSKNRNKKLRNITYGDKTYKWMVDMAGPENDRKRIRIWEDKNTVLFEDFLTSDSIAPGDVAFIIESIVVNR
jgi:hypothetical protein